MNWCVWAFFCLFLFETIINRNSNDKTKKTQTETPPEQLKVIKTEIYTLNHVRRFTSEITSFSLFQIDFKTELCRIGIFGGMTQTFTYFYFLINFYSWLKYISGFPNISIKVSLCSWNVFYENAKPQSISWISWFRQLLTFLRAKVYEVPSIYLQLTQRPH